MVDLPNNPLPKPAQIVAVMNEDKTCMLGVTGTPKERTDLLFALCNRCPELLQDMAAVLGSYAIQGVQLEGAVDTQARRIVELTKDHTATDRERFLGTGS